jgi:hypothetical protein
VRGDINKKLIIRRMFLIVGSLVTKKSKIAQNLKVRAICFLSQDAFLQTSIYRVLKRFSMTFSVEAKFQQCDKYGGVKFLPRHEWQ